MTDFMRQCEMERARPDGSRETTTSFIPEEFAQVGRYLKLKDNDQWVDGWKVVSVGARRSKKESNDRSRDFLRQRKASDV